MKFFATVAAMACIAHGVFLENEADEAFEMWTAQVQAGEMSPEVYMVLAQALDDEIIEEADFAEVAKGKDGGVIKTDESQEFVRRNLKHVTPDQQHISKKMGSDTQIKAQVAKGKDGGVIKTDESQEFVRRNLKHVDPSQQHISTRVSSDTKRK